MSINFKNRTILLLIVTTLLSALFNYLFLWTHWGISVLLYNSVLLTAYYFTSKRKPSFNIHLFILCALILIVLSIPFLRFDYWLFKCMNSLIIVTIYGFLASSLFELNLCVLIKSIFLGVFMPFEKIHYYTKDTSSHILNNSKTFKKVVLGITFAILVFIIVLPLLLSSDTVFNSKLSTAFGFMNFIEVNKFVLRVIMFFLLSSYIYAQLMYTPLPSSKPEGKSIPMNFDTIMSNVFLTCINLVYVLFSYIQIKYLFLGTQLPGDMSYSQYARQGFFQLVFVTAINMLIIILFNKFKRPNILTNSLLIITVACTYIMTFSAFYRMHLYQSTFGFTRLRLLVDLFLIAEIISLIPIIIGILKPRFKFLEIAFLTLFIYYLGITFINIDAFVADQNIQRYTTLAVTSKADFDIAYLDTLSKDALLKLDELIPKTDEETAQYFRETILIKFVNNYYEPKWFEYNIANQHANDLYQKYYPDAHDPNNIPSHNRGDWIKLSN